jgi:hypothetical protein
MSYHACEKRTAYGKAVQLSRDVYTHWEREILKYDAGVVESKTTRQSVQSVKSSERLAFCARKKRGAKSVRT